MYIKYERRSPCNSIKLFCHAFCRLIFFLIFAVIVFAQPIKITSQGFSFLNFVCLCNVQKFEGEKVYMKKCLKYRPETSVSHKWNIGFKTLALDLGIKKGPFFGQWWI